MMRLTNLHMNEFNSIQFNSIAIILNFIFLLIPALFLIYYVYSLGIYLLNEIYFLICYFQISQILKFQKLENCIFIFKNAF